MFIRFTKNINFSHRENGLRFKVAEWWNPNCNDEPNEVDTMDNSYLLLFMITKDTRGLETMALVIIIKIIH